MVVVINHVRSNQANHFNTQEFGYVGHAPGLDRIAVQWIEASLPNSDWAARIKDPKPSCRLDEKVLSLEDEWEIHATSDALGEETAIPVHII